MKSLFKTVLIACLILFLMDATLAQGNLSVTVTNVKEAKGKIQVGLFTDKGTFLKEAKLGKSAVAQLNEVTVVFENLPVGDYAISVIHDENENGELDSNFMGIPKEGFGFGNNAMGMFGPPSFEDALIKWDGQTKSVGVRLKYM